MVLHYLCEAAEKKAFSVDLTSVFTFIGMAFSIVVSLVALVWLTCFVVRLLIKTFKTQVNNSYNIFVENSSAKAESKKERNAIKRKAKDARKMELLNLKQESKERIHKLKVEKLGLKLMEVEEKAKEKYGSKPESKEETISEKIKKQEAIEKIEKEPLKKEKKVSESKQEESKKEQEEIVETEE